jgi:hypothetical protein
MAFVSISVNLVKLEEKSYPEKFQYSGALNAALVRRTAPPKLRTARLGAELDSGSKADYSCPTIEPSHLLPQAQHDLQQCPRCRWDQTLDKHEQAPGPQDTVLKKNPFLRVLPPDETG